MCAVLGWTLNCASQLPVLVVGCERSHGVLGEESVSYRRHHEYNILNFWPNLTFPLFQWNEVQKRQPIKRVAAPLSWTCELVIGVVFQRCSSGKNFINLAEEINKRSWTGGDCWLNASNPMRTSRFTPMMNVDLVWVGDQVVKTCFHTIHWKLCKIIFGMLSFPLHCLVLFYHCEAFVTAHQK